MATRLLRRWLLSFVLVALGLSVFYKFQYAGLQYTGLMWRPGSEQPHERPIDWKHRQIAYPVASYRPLPTGKPESIPDIQAVFPDEAGDRKAWRIKRQAAVKQAFIKSWNAYKKNAWLHDEVAPITGQFKDTFGGWGASLVDSLDTLWIMGLEDEFAKAVQAVERIDFTRTTRDMLNVFETTIRYLGGMLSAHDLSGGKYPVLLRKATELGDMLYAAFDTPNRMPVTRWFWANAITGGPERQKAHTRTLSAEIGSLTLEMTRLSQLTGDPKYYDAVQRVSDELEKQQDQTHIPGLWPIVFDADSLNFTLDTTFTLGGMADSLYEYLPKEYLILGGHDQYRTMYEKFVDAAQKHLFFRPLNPDDRDILISGTARTSADGKISLDPEGQHLTCFIGGVLGISSKIFKRPQDLTLAKKLVGGCMWAYETAPNGIMPELFRTWPCPDSKCAWSEEEWYKGVLRHGPSVDSSIRPPTDADYAATLIAQQNLPKGFTEVRDSRYILRPETIESVFVLYRITGDTKYQDIAWNMFATIVRNVETDLSYAALANVMVKDMPKIDSQESFWMAETLKYFYLIFSEPDLISLDDYVL